MTSVQERLQLKRMALDNWSTREKLCLASAVSCSGDQNWMSVSRSLKMLCGANRPADWFSQKSCAVQYGELLENVETPKRKKRTVSERDSSIAETPTESILRKLTQERIAELKAQIQKDQEEYAKLREDILLVQSSNVTEGQLKEMWAQIEQEQEQKVMEQQKYAQWLKEREERKSEIQKAWRPSSFPQTQMQPGQKPASLNIGQKQEEMEIDDVNTKHGTAPLLTSLLKSSSSPAPGTTSSAVHPTPTASTSVRMAAPTITNLLTGNSTSQITSLPVTTAQQYHQIHTQPLTGPIPTEAQPQIIPSPSQAAPTLSMLLENKGKEEQGGQLNLDEVKSEQAEPMDTEDGGSSPNKDDDQQLMEVFNGLIPDNIDELEDILTNNNAIILNPELLEEESILEDVECLMDEQDETNDNKTIQTANSADALQQRPQSEYTESKNLPDSSDSSKIKEEIKEENETSLDPENVPKIEDSSGGGTKADSEDKAGDCKQEIVEIPEETATPAQVQSPEVKEEKTEEVVQKIESSDDSSDNTTLQSLKEKIQVDHKNVEDSPQPKSPVEDVLMEISTAITAKIENSEALLDDVKLEGEIAESSVELADVVMTEDKMEDQVPESKKSPSGSPDVIIITEDSDSNDAKSSPEKERKDVSPRKLESPTKHNKPPISSEGNKTPEKQSPSKHTPGDRSSTPASLTNSSTPKETKIELDTSSLLPEPTTTITIIDTDDDSPIEVTKDDKVNKNKRDYSRARKSDSHSEKKSEESGIFEESKQNLSIRKLKERDGSESPLIDDENSDAIPRTRRRYSSTPVIDSIPSSPASSDDREYKAWKKSILMIYNRIATHRHASIFLRPVTEEVAPNYKRLVLRPMDLHTIKKNIENGVIRSTIEFQRDVMLMCQNAIIYNKKDNNVYNMAKEMMAESVAVIESLIESVRRDNEKIANSSIIKGRSRKSHRLP